MVEKSLVGLFGEMKASVIVPTRNRADVLDQCLESLCAQSFPIDEFEVIVIDNGSTDHTLEVVNRYKDQLQLRYRYVKEPGLHVGRHEGCHLAKSDLLMYIDDDVVVSSEWVSSVVETFQDVKVSLVGGNNYPNFEVAPPEWLTHMWNEKKPIGKMAPSLSILDFGEGFLETDPYLVWGCNFSIRKDVLKAAGGFHPDGVPKDRLRFRGDGETHVSDFIKKSGLKAMFNSSASVHHLVSIDRMTPQYFEQRSYLQGISDSYTHIRRYAGIDLPISLKFKQFVSGVRSQFRNRLGFINNGRDSVVNQVVAIQRAMKTAYWQGYSFHRSEVKSDPLLLQWVLQESYMPQG